MGYSMNVTEIDSPRNDLDWYGAKLFGYYKNDVLDSMQYLISLGKVDDDAIWDYGIENEITLTADEFRTFLDLYQADFDREYKKRCETRENCIYVSFSELSNDSLKEMYKSDYDKRLWWN